MVIVSKHQEPILDKVQLNEDIAKFPQVHPITEDMKIEHSGVSRLVMIDRYSFKDTEKKTFKIGDFVVLTVKEDPNSLRVDLDLSLQLMKRMEKQIFGLKKNIVLQSIIRKSRKQASLHDRLM